MGYKILSACDKTYFKFLKVMVKSAMVNFPASTVYVELVNMDKKFKTIIENIDSKCKAEITSVDFKNPNQRKCYCTNRRVELFNKMRKKCDDVLIWIDADSIIRRSCNELMKITKTHDVSAVVRPKGTLRGGIIAINNTDMGNKFIKKYVKIMKPLNQWNKAKDTKKIQSDPFTWEVWMSNQNCLDYLCRKWRKTDLRFAALDNLYCDVHLKDEGIIWAAKNRLKTSPIYLEELKKYN
jgi:lipopolysaccharide biosynthesis glycosyltransferase